MSGRASSAIPPQGDNEFGHYLLEQVIQHRDEMGHLANSPADDLRDALRCAADEIEDLRSLLRAVLDGWDADVEATPDFGGHALVLHPGGCISARRRISVQQVDVFRRAYQNGSEEAGR